jgi:hypothetical protein
MIQFHSKTPEFDIFFGRPWKKWHILWPICIVYGHLVYFMPIRYILCPFVSFMAIWYILCPFGIFYANLVYFMPIWYILWPFSIGMYVRYGHFVYWPFSILYGNLVYFMAIWCILWPLGIFYGYLVYNSNNFNYRVGL